MTFTAADDSGKQVDLKRGGKNIEVTNANKMEYICSYIEYKLEKQFEKAVIPFASGFGKVINCNLIEIFNESEFETLISGGDIEIDIKDLKDNTKYAAGYKGNQRYIRVRRH